MLNLWIVFVIGNFTIFISKLTFDNNTNIVKYKDILGIVQLWFVHFTHRYIKSLFRFHYSEVIERDLRSTQNLDVLL